MILAIIQARMGSTRLPGKVLMNVDGKPLLFYQLERVFMSNKLDKVVVATSSLKRDDAIEAFCASYKVDCYRGSENDVMKRYYDCAKQYSPEVVVRMTADCPLVDPEVIDSVIHQFESDNVDYCANTVPPETSTFPDGSDVEVFSMRSLEKANESILNSDFREHVTFQFWQDKSYSSSQYTSEEDFSRYRITVDYPEDLIAISHVIRKLNERSELGTTKEIVKVLEDYPDIYNLNSQYWFGIGWKK